MKPTNRSASARSAFTLIEVLVVIAITSLLAGLILSYSSASRDRVALSVQQAKLAQTIVKAKSLTVSTYNDPVIPCGYGIHINYPNVELPDGAEPNTYTVFSYDLPDLPALSDCKNITDLNPEFETKVLTESIPANLTFAEPDSEAITDILFLPPNPDTWIWLHGGLGTSTSGRIPLKSKSGDFSVNVLVSSAGQISF